MREAYVVGASSSRSGFSRYRFAFLAIFCGPIALKAGAWLPTRAHKWDTLATPALEC